MSHARLAPSSAYLWGPDGCPASVQMQERQPEQEETTETREGDAGHWLLAQTLLKLTVPADAIAPNGVPINQEMRESIVELVEDIFDTVGQSQSGDFYQVEQRVQAHKTIHPMNDGTPDCYFVQHSCKTVHIWDFKYGHAFVDAFRNWQMLNYAAGVIETEEIADWRDWTFTLTIAQPRCYVRDELGGTLREWFTSGAELAPLFDALRQAAYEALDPAAKLKTGPHCEHCRAAWDCPANQQAAGRFMAVITKQGTSFATNDSLGFEAKVLAEAKAFVEARLKNLHTQIQMRLDAGERVPHHRIEWSRPRTVWDKEKIPEIVNIVQMFGVEPQPGVALASPREIVKQGIDETVIAPYTTKNPPAKKVALFSDSSAAKILGRR